MFLRHKQSTSGFDVSDITAEKMPVARKTEVFSILDATVTRLDIAG